MFEAMNSIPSQPTVVDAVLSQGTSFRPQETSTVPRSGDIPSPTDQSAQAQKRAEKDKKAEDRHQLTQKMLDDLEQDIESIHNIGLSFAKADESGKTVIKVMDKTNDKVIREIPSEEALHLAAKIEEMIGILFDKKV